ncbi:GDSL esterase/lipase [Vitis vinifera]|uniref:GDSL esterase/lipase n=1 Tax=Vitis vinifera TaxID=29760 RepID=A0A438C429_VITVI|nr:GDSL esterase/lipase [Vitis vinifera]
MSCFLLFKALVLITLGRNDFVNNYYLVPNSTRSRQFTLPNYVCYLISKCRKNLMVETLVTLEPFPMHVNFIMTYMYGLNLWLQRLYKLGARRVFVTGTGPMGCVPAEHAMRSKNRECAAELQQDQRRRFHGRFTWL